MTDDIEDYPVTQHHSDFIVSNIDHPSRQNRSIFDNLNPDHPLNQNVQNYHLDNYNEECMKTMYSLFQTGKLTDVILKVNQECFPCHKVVLAGSSPYFRAMFTSGMREATMSEIPIHCISSKAIHSLLHFIYTGDISISESNVCELLSASTMLQMNHVVKACCTYLEKQFHPSNIIGIYDFATTNGCGELANNAHKFIDINFNEVARYDEFLNLRSCQLIQIINRDELNVRSETEMFNAVIRWTNHDRLSRLMYLNEILSHVRMHQMPPHFIRSQIKNCDFLRVDNNVKARLEAILDDLLEHKKVNIKPRNGGYKEVVYSAGGYYKYSLATFECFMMHSYPGNNNKLSFPSFSNHNKITFNFNQGNSDNEFSNVAITNGKWCTLPDIPTARSGLAACSVHGRLYLIGGRNNSEQCNLDTPRVDSFDPDTAQWTSCAPMSIPRHRVAVGVIDDLIYAVGGSASKPSINQYHNNLCVMHHHRLSPIGVEEHSARTGNHGNGVTGGATQPSPSVMHHNSAERFDPDSGQWTPIAPMTHRRIGLGVATVNRLLYAVGGFDGENRLGSVERYDPDTDSWEFVAPLNKTRSGAGVVAIDQHIYAIGGYDSDCQLSSVEKYDAGTNRWCFVAPMISPRSALGAAVYQGKIWVFGGYDGNEFLTSVEVYDTITNNWTEVGHMNAGKSGHAIFVGREPSF